jgi:hypothetical protein
MHMKRLRSVTWIAVAAIGALFASAEPPPASDASHTRAADKAALAPLQSLIGQWKGVGQPQRGSAKGSWSEKSDWAWRFAGGRAELVFHAPDGKYFSQARLRPAAKSGDFELLATLPDGNTEVRYTGTANPEGKLIVRADKAGAEAPAQVTIQTVANGDRMVMLYEQQAGDRLTRMAEVGSTREGVTFAAGSGKPECPVTGGVGTIAVQHNGQTYYVCCTGCRDLFLADPEGVLADYRARKAQKK